MKNTQTISTLNLILLTLKTKNQKNLCERVTFISGHRYVLTVCLFLFLLQRYDGGIPIAREKPYLRGGFSLLLFVTVYFFPYLCI